MGFSKDCSRTRKDSENQGIKEKVDTKKQKANIPGRAMVEMLG